MRHLETGKRTHFVLLYFLIQTMEGQNFSPITWDKQCQAWNFSGSGTNKNKNKIKNKNIKKKEFILSYKLLLQHLQRVCSFYCKNV